MYDNILKLYCKKKVVGIQQLWNYILIPQTQVSENRGTELKAVRRIDRIKTREVLTVL